MLGMPTGPSNTAFVIGALHKLHPFFFSHQLIKHTNRDIDFILLLNLIVRLLFIKGSPQDYVDAKRYDAKEYGMCGVYCVKPEI